MKWVLAVCLATATWGAVATAAETETATEGKLSTHQLKVDGRERTYQLYSPTQPRKKMPVVIVLHGGGGGARTAQQFIEYVGMNNVAERERFLVAYPVAVDGNWNDGRNVAFMTSHKENIDDVGFIRQMVDEIAKDQSVDRSRIFCTGISNGGIMSHRMAADASDLVAAIAPVVGGMAEPLAKDFAPKFPVSLFVIQGDSDPLVPIDGGNVGFRIGKKRGRIISAKNAVALYAKRAKIEGEIKSSELKDADTADGTTTSAGQFPIGIGGTRLQVYVVRNGGHTWPGKPQYLNERLIGKTSQDFDATEAIWEFFAACPPRK